MEKDKRSAFQKAKDARSNMRIKTHLEVFVYRSMTNLEANGVGKPVNPIAPIPKTKPDDDHKRPDNSENAAVKNVGKFNIIPKIAASKI